MEKKKKGCYRKFFCDQKMSDDLEKVASELGGIYVAAVIRIAVKKYLDQRKDEQFRKLLERRRNKPKTK